MTVFHMVLSFLAHEIWAPQVFIQCKTLYHVQNMQEVCVHQHKFCVLKFRFQYACRLHSKLNEVLAFSLFYDHLIYCKNLIQILGPEKRPVNALQLIKRSVDERVIQL